jgi:7,8-dihydro-6-hydroxymethylpterin-pyrophosphokinase
VGSTDLAPDAVLALAKRLELLAGRRLAPRHGPRPLDIDLLLWGSRVSDLPELTLPHRSMRRRRFVLAPLADLAPDLRVPPDGARVSALLARVGQEGEVERIGWRTPFG